MPKIAIIVSPCPSHPTTAGNRARVFEIGRRLRLYGFRVLFIHYDLERVSKEAHESMAAYWDEYYAVYVPDNRRRLETLEPETFTSHDLRMTVRRICQSSEASLLIVNYVWMAGVLDVVPSGIVKVIDVHDRFGYRHELLRLMGIQPSWVTLSPHQEAVCATKADAIWCVSREETYYFRRLVDRPVYYIGHPVNSSFLSGQSYEFPRKFLFFGSNNPVNQLSLSYVQRAAKYLSGNAEFLICGGISSLVDSAPPNIRTLEYAPDLSVYFAAGWIAVNPVFIGTGNKIKTIDSLRYGAPIVSGQAGFYGVETDEPLHQLPDERSFIDALERIAKGQISVDDLATASRRVFTEFERTTRLALEDFLRTCFSESPPSQLLPLPAPIPDEVLSGTPSGGSAWLHDTLVPPLGWSKADFVRLSYSAVRAGQWEVGLAAVTACLALDPTSATLNLLRAFIAFSLERQDEAESALATYDWLVRRGAADYVSKPQVAEGVSIFAGTDQPATIRTMIRLGEAIAPMVWEGGSQLAPKEAVVLERLARHLGILKEELVRPEIPVMLPRTRGAEVDHAARDIFEARVFIPTSTAKRSQVLVLETGEIRDIDMCTLTDGNDHFELIMHSPGRYVMPAQLLARAQDVPWKVLELAVRAPIHGGDFDKFGENLRLSLVDEKAPVPEPLFAYSYGGATSCLLRDVQLGLELRGSGWHNADRLDDGSYGRWTRRRFSLVQSSLRCPGARIFFEIEVGGVEHRGPVVTGVAVEGHPMEFTVNSSGAVWSVVAELDPEIVARRAWELEVIGVLEERLAGEHDRRMISLYVTRVRFWALVPPDEGDIDILNWLRGNALRNPELSQPLEFRLAGLRSSPGSLRLNLVGNLADEENVAECGMGDVAIEWNEQLLPPHAVADATLAFRVAETIDRASGSSLRLYPPSGGNSLQITGIRFLPDAPPPTASIYGARQDRYWSEFSRPEHIEGRIGRWMSARGTLRFVAPEHSILTVHVLFRRDPDWSGRLSAALDGNDIAYHLEAWPTGDCTLIFDVPAAAVERSLTLSVQDSPARAFEDGEGDRRSIVVTHFVVEPGPPGSSGLGMVEVIAAATAEMKPAKKNSKAKNLRKAKPRKASALAAPMISAHAVVSEG